MKESLTTSNSERNEGPVRTLATALEQEIGWFTLVIDQRFRIHGGELSEDTPLPDPPSLVPGSSSYADLVARLQAGPPERLLLVLALLPHLRPQALDPFLLTNTQTGRAFTEFGGVDSRNHRGFLPNGETALFLLAGDDLALRIQHLRLFDPAHPLWTRNVLQFAPLSPGEPTWSSTLMFSATALRDLLAETAS